MKRFLFYVVAVVMTTVIAACGGGNDPEKIAQEAIGNLKGQKVSETLKYVHPDDGAARAELEDLQKFMDAGGAGADFFNRDYTFKETESNPESNACLVVYSYPADNIFGSDDLYVYLQQIDGKWFYRGQYSAGYISNIKKCIQNGIQLPALCNDREARKLLK